MGTDTAASVGFITRSGVGVSTENHFAFVVGGAVVRIGGAVIEEMVDCLFCGFSGVGLASGDGVEGGQNFVVNCTGIVEEGSNDALDAFNTVLWESWRVVGNRCELCFAAVVDR